MTKSWSQNKTLKNKPTSSGTNLYWSSGSVGTILPKIYSLPWLGSLSALVVSCFSFAFITRPHWRSFILVYRHEQTQVPGMTWPSSDAQLACLFSDLRTASWSAVVSAAQSAPRLHLGKHSTTQISHANYSSCAAEHGYYTRHVAAKNTNLAVSKPRTFQSHILSLYPKLPAAKQTTVWKRGPAAGFFLFVRL